MIIERFSELSVRERLLIVAGIGVLLAMVAEFAVISPALKQIKVLDGKIQAERELEAKHRSVMAVREDVVAAYDRVRDRLGESGDETEMNERLKQHLDDWGVACGVSIRARKHKAPSAEQFVVTYSVEISEFEGNVDALVKLLEKIETADGLLRVEQLSVKALDGGKVAGSMRITQVMTHSGERQGGTEI
jgi:type II secretory pathway component PulM